MFAALSDRVAIAIDVVKMVLGTNDKIREVLLRPTFQAESRVEPPNETIRDLLSAVSTAPNRLDWQLYDYCASLTRLYAIFDSFLDEVIGDYLSVLPEIFDEYSKLPESLLRQHRLGVAQILSKLSKEGHYRHLSETDVITLIFQGLSGSKPYKLLVDAFFIDPQNYRLAVLVRLLSSLGISGAREKLIKHPRMVDFRNRERDEDYALEAELSDFVERRNEAAHSEVNSTVSSELINKFADLVKVLCVVIGDLLDQEIAQMRVQCQKSARIGSIYKIYKKRTVGLVRIEAISRLTERDELLLVRKRKVIRTVPLEIQMNDIREQAVELSPGQTLGILFSTECNEGDEVHLLRQPPAPRDQTELFVPETAVDEEAETLPEDAGEPSTLDDSEGDGGADAQEDGKLTTGNAAIEKPKDA
jgi:hypothetical protein